MYRLLYSISDRIVQQLQMVMNAATLLFPALGSLHTSHQFCAMCFTGCRSSRELSSKSLCWLLTEFGAWGRRISCASVFPCLTTLPGPVFVLLNVATCSFLERGRNWEQRVSAWLPLLCGTHCRLSFARRLSAMILSSPD